jgi:tetratricopeptide (TPR) repeat protein
VPPDKDAGEIRKKLPDILRRLGDDSWEVREKASDDLTLLGPKAVPLIAPHVSHRDPEIAWRVQAALAKLKGAPGEALEGLSLTAAMAGPKPRPGEAAALWLTITNVSDHDVHIFQYFWRLNLQSEKESGTEHARMVGADSPAAFTAQDFLCLKPGESLGCLMDADPTPAAKGQALTRAYLEISLPPGAQKVAEKFKGSTFSGARELVSGAVEMSYAEDPAGLDAEAAALAAGFLAGKADAEKLLDPRAKNGKALETALAALRAGLRRADESERWKFFEFACAHPHAAVEDEVIDFLARYGPRMKQEDEMISGLRALRDALPAERRPILMLRAALVMLHDWRSASILVSPYTVSGNPDERAVAARVFLLLHERGDRRPQVMNWLALELFTARDTKLKDAKKALEIAELAAKADPDNVAYQFTLAVIRGKQEDLEAIAAKARTADEKNSVAWDLATKFPASQATGNLAVRLGTQAVDESREEGGRLHAYCVGTLASCHAARGDYAKAQEFEQKALELMAQDDPAYGETAQRIARFTALAKAGADERPAMVLDQPKLHSKEARDALLGRLAVEKHPLVKAEVVRLLRVNFSSDPEVKKVLPQQE